MPEEPRDIEIAQSLCGWFIFCNFAFIYAPFIWGGGENTISMTARRKKEIRIYVVIAVALVIAAMGCAVADTPDNEEADGGDLAAARHYEGLDHAVVPGNSKSREKVYEGFSVSFNADNGTPNWVAWELLGSEVAGDIDRSDNFWQDKDLEGCPSTSDYTRSGYDRGHMCPAADQKWSVKAMTDCFVMANICPQDHALNAGAWNTLEGKERQWAQRDSAIVIIAGPVYEPSDTKRIGASRVRVPGAFFKVILAPYCEHPRAIGFVYPNMTSPGNMQNYAMSVDDVEALTGIDFFEALPDEIEEMVEREYSFSEWNRKK